MTKGYICETPDGTTVHWTYDAAEKARGASLRNQRQIITAELDPITMLVDEYYMARELVSPDLDDAMHFLTSETGEVADAIVEYKSRGYKRNNPQNKTKDVASEIGDVLMMSTMVAVHVQSDPITAMVAKFKRKGYDKDA